MSKKAVLGTAIDRPQTETIVYHLYRAGFDHNHISVIFLNSETSRDFAVKNSTKLPEGVATGAGTGGIIGGALGLLAGIGTLVIPGLGPFVAAGPILGALSGAALGAAVGGIAGGLVGMGIPEYEAKLYEGKVKEGNVLIAVHTDTSTEIDRAKQIFEQYGASNISTATEEGIKHIGGWGTKPDLPPDAKRRSTTGK
jgi:hypothetical protein